MVPRLDRCVGSLSLDDQLRVERALCQRFREHAPVYLSQVELRYLTSAWLELVVMQHYGAPTRLLDWSKSPWIALFFAVSESFDTDGFVYGFSRSELENSAIAVARKKLPNLVCGPHRDLPFSDEAWDHAEINTDLLDPTLAATLPKWVVTYYCRVGHFPRLIAQQGLFTFASKPGTDHWQQIMRYAPSSFVLRIKKPAKQEILRELNVIGINAATLFPGIEGVSKSLEGFARAWPLFPRPPQF